MDNHKVGHRNETSLVAMQFMEIARGAVAVHVPQNEFVTVTVETEEHYCLKCFTEGVWDIWFGNQDGLSFKLGRCRMCGWEKTL